MELLERASAAAEMARLLRQAAAGRGSLLLLGGEAGVGKSALVRSFGQAAVADADVLVGACDPLATPRPLGPLVDVAPALGRVERALGGGDRAEAFRALLAELAERKRPALLVLEDVHWADEATLDLLRYLGRRVEGTRALLVATYRDDEVGPAHPLRVVLGDLATAPGVRRLTLEPLSANAVHQLAAGSSLNAAELHRRTGGNPFFVTEALAAGGGIPSTVRDAVLARAARLSVEGRAALRAAAVAGVRAEPWLLDAVAGGAAAGLDECLAQGLLRAEDGWVVFRHELAREAVVGTIEPHRRVALHRAALEALGARPDGGADPARLAEHAEAAGDAAAVLEHAPAAAARAAALGAHRQAASQYARALRFANALAPAERALLLEESAVEWRLTENTAEAVRALEGAVETRRELGDRLLEGRNLAQLSSLLRNAGRPEEADRALHAALAQLEALPPGPELATAYAAQAQAHMVAHEFEATVEWGEKAIALAERVGATDRLIGGHNAVGTALICFGEHDRGRDHLERSMALAREAGLDAYVANAYGNLGSTLGERYQLALADRYLTEGIAYAAERDIDSSRLYMLSWLALVRVYQGRWDEGIDAAETVLRRPGARAISRVMALLALGRVAARRGDPDAWAVLHDALEVACRIATLQRVGLARCVRAEAAWLGGNPPRAAEEARAAFDAAVEHRHSWFVGELAFWRWRAGDLDAAPPGAAEPYARQIAGDWAGAAAAWRKLGCPYEAARALADADDESTLRETLAELERLGARPLAEIVIARLRAMGVRLPRPARPTAGQAAEPAGPLSPREREVAALVGRGLTNRQIAEELVVSVRTAESHVASILGKLGLGTRAQLASWATRRGLAVPDQ